MGLFIGIYYDCVLVWSIKYIIMVIYQQVFIMIVFVYGNIYFIT